MSQMGPSRELALLLSFDIIVPAACLIMTCIGQITSLSCLQKEEPSSTHIVVTHSFEFPSAFTHANHVSSR